jgi:hypothetical protein
LLVELFNYARISARCVQILKLLTNSKGSAKHRLFELSVSLRSLDSEPSDQRLFGCRKGALRGRFADDVSFSKVFEANGITCLAEVAKC